MADTKAMSVTAFQTNLKNRYKEDGEADVDARVEALTSAIVKQNEENNPFIFSEFLRVIEAQDIRIRRTNWFKWCD